MKILTRKSLALTASFFEGGAMPTPTKSQRPIILGQGGPDSTL